MSFLFSNRNYSILYFLIMFQTPLAEVVFFIAEIKKCRNIVENGTEMNLI